MKLFQLDKIIPDSCEYWVFFALGLVILSCCVSELFMYYGSSFAIIILIDFLFKGWVLFLTILTGYISIMKSNDKW